VTRTGTTFFPKRAKGLEVVGFESFALCVRARFVAAGEDCLTATLLLKPPESLFFDIER
jgi:hypothetical protein